MSIGSILSKIAPELETGLSLLGGPYAALGALALKTVNAVVSPDKPQSVDQVMESLASSTPEQLLALKKANQEFAEKMAELNINLAKIQAEREESDARDRESARALASARGFLPQVVISAVFLIGYFSLIVMITIGSVAIPDKYQQMYTALLGVITVGVPQILNFWLGSSHGSQKKDLTLQSRQP